MVGPKDKDESIGYYGERIVLKAFELGINSCWVALTYKKGKADVKIGAGEKLYMVVALGYGERHRYCCPGYISFSCTYDVKLI